MIVLSVFGTLVIVKDLWRVADLIRPKSRMFLSCSSQILPGCYLLCSTLTFSLLRFHSTESLLFSCSLGEVDVIVWNAETGAKLATLQGHQGNVTDIAFSPLDEQFATYLPFRPFF